MLDGNRLGTAIAQAIKTNFSPSMTGTQYTQLEQSWKVIAAAIVSELTAHAEVASTGTATVTTAPGTAPVTATGTIS